MTKTLSLSLRVNNELSFGFLNWLFYFTFIVSASADCFGFAAESRDSSLQNWSRRHFQLSLPLPLPSLFPLPLPGILPLSLPVLHPFLHESCS